jgi:hypothetical protein
MTHDQQKKAAVDEAMRGIPEVLADYNDFPEQVIEIVRKSCELAYASGKIDGLRKQTEADLERAARHEFWAGYYKVAAMGK